jgi:hypothetical protein
MMYGKLAPNSPLIQLFRKSSNVVNDSPCGIGTRNIKTPNAEPNRNLHRFFAVTYDFSILSPLVLLFS